MNIRRKHIRELVSALLEEHNISRAPIPIEQMIISKGAVIVKDKVEQQVSGFYYRGAGSTNSVIGVNQAHPKNRQRFTLAHELGHLLLHDSVGVHVDKEVIRLRDSKSSSGSDIDEIEANIFAAELLMPESLLRRDLLGLIDSSSPDFVKDLAGLYKVSEEAMTIRLTNLGYLGFH